MTYKPYHCGDDCRGGYYCLICLIVFNLRKIGKKLKKILTRKNSIKNHPSNMDKPQNIED